MNYMKPVVYFHCLCRWSWYHRAPHSTVLALLTTSWKTFYLQTSCAESLCNESRVTVQQRFQKEFHLTSHDSQSVPYFCIFTIVLTVKLFSSFTNREMRWSVRLFLTPAPAPRRPTGRQDLRDQWWEQTVIHFCRALFYSKDNCEC